MSNQSPTQTAGPSPRCLVRTVAEVMNSEPTLEAVKFDRARMAQRAMPYERLDQLVVELLLGVR